MKVRVKEAWHVVVHVSCVSTNMVTWPSGQVTYPTVEHHGLVLVDGKLTTMSLEGLEACQ